MHSFLLRVAQTFFNLHDKNISSFTFVFPNRRAGIFFQKHLADIAGKPLFSPEIITIDECFLRSSGMIAADRLSLLFRLYKIYKEISHSEETFDSFAFWGEILLNDFNEVDKYRVNAQQLFSNITELKEIDSLFNSFSQNQIEAIRQFWSTFVPMPENDSRQNFLETWRLLYPVYEKLKQELSAENTAYEGMIFRSVTDKLLNNNSIEWFENKKMVFVGFNALNPCERTLMLELQKRGQADFYWDYEADELRDPENPASLFYLDNIRIFPSEYEIEMQKDCLSDTHFELISIPSAVGQSKQIYKILSEIYPDKSKKDVFLKTSVILPDENLLLPVLYSIPGQIDKINVTMGYPLHLTPVSGLLDHIFELHKRKRTSGFYHHTVLNILNHQFINLLCGEEIKKITQLMIRQNMIYVEASAFRHNRLLSIIFNPDVAADTFMDYLLNMLKILHSEWINFEDKPADYQLESGFLYQYYLTVNRISGIIKEQGDGFSISMETLIKLIRQLTAGISIPFVGEPLNGLQIMGMLETRGLDFDNLIITSFNEGVFPQKSADNSFIPYHLRKGFGLPTYEHQDAITSYNFYRLLHRAKNVYLLFDSRTENGNTGEVSRFLYQLRYLYNINIHEKIAGAEVSTEQEQVISITKNSEIIRKLSLYSKTQAPYKSLSASSINTYIRCPLEFYFTHIEEIRQSDDVSEQIENDMFGTIFHAVLKALYDPYKGKEVSTGDLDLMIKDRQKIRKLISTSFAVHFFKKTSGSQVELEGNNLLIANVLLKYILGVLNNDKKNAPFKYIDGEDHCERSIRTDYGDINLKGFIDRIDQKNGITRILDYKTGGGSLEFRNWEDVFSRNVDPLKRPKYVLQTFLYGYLYQPKNNTAMITPGIYYTRNVFDENFSTQLIFRQDKNNTFPVENYFDFETEFLSGLKNCIEEIMNPEIPFMQTEKRDSCKYCDYKTLCNR